MRKIFCTLTLILVFEGCKIRLSDKDLTAFNAYNVNDTITFKNNLGVLKKYSIISKTIINKGWDENTGWYNPQVAYVKYKDLSLPDSVYYDNSFLTVYQMSKSEIEETIYFNGFLGSIDRSKQQTKEINYTKDVQIYKVPKFDMITVREPTDISYVYWTDKSGIIAFDLKNGDRWILMKK